MSKYRNVTTHEVRLCVTTRTRDSGKLIESACDRVSQAAMLAALLGDDTCLGWWSSVAHAESPVEPMVLGDIAVAWCDEGERIHQDDPKSPRVLRLRVQKRVDTTWEDCHDGSVCTMVLANTDVNTLRLMLARVMVLVYDKARREAGLKQELGRISWWNKLEEYEREI